MILSMEASFIHLFIHSFNYRIILNVLLAIDDIKASSLLLTNFFHILGGRNFRMEKL